MRCAWLVVVATALLALSMRSLGDAYYNITSVTSEQLGNAVRVTVASDGAISANVSRWWQGGEDGGYYLDWDLVHKQTTSEWSADCYYRVTKILVHLNNARPQAGNVVHIGKYPISHIRFLVTPGTANGFGLDMEVVLYKPMRVRKFEFKDWSIGYDAYLYDHHDPAWFEVTQSSDQTSLIITAASDRLADPADHLKLDDIPDNQRELKVTYADGMLDVHAKSAGLADLLNAVSRAAGVQMTANVKKQRVVTAELPGVTVDEFVGRLRDCYGLMISGSDGRLVFTDLESASTAQASVESERVAVRNIAADKALSLLPNFLADYVRVDFGQNALMVTGSRELIDKVSSDVAKIDQPTDMVSVGALVVETSVGSGLASDLGLIGSEGNYQVQTDPIGGAVSYTKMAGLDERVTLRLNALAAANKARIRSDSSVTVLSGEAASIFAGSDKYITFRRRIYDQTPVTEPVSAGVRLTVTPWVGTGTITAQVSAEVTEVGEVDAMTGLPVVNRRTADGMFRVRPGETIVIGGLTWRQVDRVKRRIPLLGGLPLVGWAFTKSVRRTTESELTMMLTLKIADGPLRKGDGE